MPGLSAIEMLDLTGVYIFALTGSLVALRHRLDIVGVVALGLVTAVAGGVIRDVLLGDLPPQVMRSNRYLIATGMAAVTVVVTPRLVERLRQPVLVLDALGLGLFATVGAARAAQLGLGLGPAVIAGTISAVGGGLLRDLLAGDVPQIFAPDSRLYAIPAALGAVVTVVGHRQGLDLVVAQAAAVGMTVSLRLLALHYQWRAPVPSLRRPGRWALRSPGRGLG